MTDKYEFRTNSDAKSPEHTDPRYSEWDKRSRQELKERLYAAITRRQTATETVIPTVIQKELKMYGIDTITEVKDGNFSYSFTVSDETVLKITKTLINKQIDEWKGLRWWRFNDKKQCDSWPKWFKKAKCWQDQNQHKPLGHFWCLIFEQLKIYTNKISYNIFCNEPNKRDTLSLCLFSKSILEILKGNVRFERTRETPLLPIRVLTQSKQLQQKLYKINNKFTLQLWKQKADAVHKQQKCKSNKRSNVANILNEKCLECAENIYKDHIKQLKQMIPSINISNNNANVSGYGPSYGVNNSVESQRYSPMLSSMSSSISSLSHSPPIPSPQPSIQSYNYNQTNDLQRLDMENRQLRGELNELKYQLLLRRRPMPPPQRISPMYYDSYRMPPMYHEMDMNVNGYEPNMNMPMYVNDGRRFMFPASGNVYRPGISAAYNYHSPRNGFEEVNDEYTLPTFPPFDTNDSLF